MFTMSWRRWTRLDLKDQYFGCEIEMTGITREQAAQLFYRFALEHGLA